jgi:hypothetical protein
MDRICIGELGWICDQPEFLSVQAIVLWRFDEGAFSLDGDSFSRDEIGRGGRRVGLLQGVKWAKAAGDLSAFADRAPATQLIRSSITSPAAEIHRRAKSSVLFLAMGR